MNATDQAREALVSHGRSLFERGLCPGSSGNISVRVPEGFLATPTNSCLGRLDPDRLSLLDSQGQLLSGDKASKEARFHLAIYARRPEVGAIVHLHSTYAVALSCLEGLDESSVLPPLTPYVEMRVGPVPLVAYHPPGSDALADAIALASQDHDGILLANHGPVVLGATLEAAVYGMEELEEASKLALILHGARVRLIPDEEIRRLNDARRR